MLFLVDQSSEFINKGNCSQFMIKTIIFDLNHCSYKVSVCKVRHIHITLMIFVIRTALFCNNSKIYSSIGS